MSSRVGAPILHLVAVCLAGALVLPAQRDRAAAQTPRTRLHVPVTAHDAGLASGYDLAGFLNACPASDPMYATIRKDFVLRRDGRPVDDVPCTEPMTTTSPMTYELVALQALRVMLYQDHGRANYLPWTPLSYYDWMRSKIGGIDIRSDTDVSFCCTTFEGRPYIAIDAANRDYNLPTQRRWLIDHPWEIVSAQIALFGHETRHVDGYPHGTMCPTATACDPAYDESDLGAFGLAQAELVWLNSLGPILFMRPQPPHVSMPARPGGKCQPLPILTPASHPRL